VGRGELLATVLGARGDARRTLEDEDLSVVNLRKGGLLASTTFWVSSDKSSGDGDTFEGVRDLNKMRFAAGELVFTGAPMSDPLHVTENTHYYLSMK